MQARSERIHFLTDKNGQPAQITGVPLWWDRGAFFERFRDREIDLENPIDLNLVCLLSTVEAMSWDEQCKKKYSEGPSVSILASRKRCAE